MIGLGYLTRGGGQCVGYYGQSPAAIYWQTNMLTTPDPSGP